MLRDIRVADLDQPIGNLVLRNGRSLPIHRANLGTLQLAQELAEKPGNVGLQIACLKRVVPDATDEELRELVPAVIEALVQRTVYGVDEVERALGESSGTGETSTHNSVPDSPTPTSATASLNATD